jgi:dihydroorotase
MLVRNSFIFLAWLIIFGHSAVPHMHHNDHEDHATHQIEQTEIGFLEYLAQLFHFSSGERHLEDFRTNNGISTAFLLPPSFDLPAILIFSEKISFFIPACKIQAIPISTLALRGPPFAS